MCSMTCRLTFNTPSQSSSTTTTTAAITRRSRTSRLRICWWEDGTGSWHEEWRPMTCHCSNSVNEVFLKAAVEDSPDSNMMLGMTGVFAEYDDAKTSERTRRGKLHWARQGHVVSGSMPNGYRIVKRVDVRRGSNLSARDPEDHPSVLFPPEVGPSLRHYSRHRRPSGFFPAARRLSSPLSNSHRSHNGPHHRRINKFST